MVEAYCLCARIERDPSAVDRLQTLSCHPLVLDQTRALLGRIGWPGARARRTSRDLASLGRLDAPGDFESPAGHFG